MSRKAFLFVSLLCISCARAGSITPLEIKPISSTQSDIYVGVGTKVEVRFVNEVREGAVDSFPEVPLTILDRATNQKCEINEGGIWMRRGVYLGAGERVLLVHEFSGSSGDLVLYETSTCRKLQAMDISGARWAFEDATLVVGKNCPMDAVSSCRSQQRYRLDESSLQMKPVANSESKTIEGQ
jgi:hypothetical protein